MLAKPDEPEDNARYARRRQTVEPVFGIIKAAIGFTACSSPDLHRRLQIQQRRLKSDRLIGVTPFGWTGRTAVDPDAWILASSSGRSEGTPCIFAIL
jgi:hypothetical protein